MLRLDGEGSRSQGAQRKLTEDRKTWKRKGKKEKKIKRAKTARRRRRRLKNYRKKVALNAENRLTCTKIVLACQRQSSRVCNSKL
jgi:hypothetical protein